MKRSLTAKDLDFGGADHRLRGWLLFTLEGIGRFGLAPVSHERLHLLLYFAAVLTPLYRLQTPVPKIIKHAEMPFYPEAQKELERLAVSGHVENTGRRSVRDHGWFSDSYAITSAGIETARLLAETAWGRRVRDFANDLAQGFAELDWETADGIIQKDAFYREGRAEFRQTKTVTPDNEAVAVSNWVADDDENEVPPNGRDRLFLYLQYLQARPAA